MNALATVQAWLLALATASLVTFPLPLDAKPTLLPALEEEVASIFQANRACVVRIHSLHRTHPDQPTRGPGFTQGTGFVFDPAGYILTVDEAVHEAEEIRVMLPSGIQLPASLVASDPTSEVAVVRVDADSLSPARVGDPGRVRVGHFAFILGNNFWSLTPSVGTVHDRLADQDLIQVVSRVHTGYGGAPVFASTGEAVGVVWAVLGPSDLPPGGPVAGGGLAALASGWQEAPSTVFVIPIDRALRIARRLISDGEVASGWLGVEVDITGGSVVVTGVDSSGPAGEGGVAVGDRVTDYDGRVIAGAYHLRRLVMETPPDTEVQLGVRRRGQKLTARVRVGRARAPAEAVTDPADTDAEPQDMVRRIAGLERELGSLRQSLRRPPAETAGTAIQAGRPADRRAISRRIDGLAREVHRLQQLLQNE